MPCAPCAKKRKLIEGMKTQSYLVKGRDGSTQTFATLTEAQKAAAKSPGSRVTVSR